MKHGKLWPYLATTAGSILAAFSLSFFIIPNKIASGGASGLATVLYYITDGRLPVGLVIILINIPLFLLGNKRIGRRFLIRSLYGMLIMSVFTDLFTQLAEHLKVRIPVFAGITEGGPDMLLYSLFGGILLGAGIGIVLGAGSSTGGVEIASKLIEKKYPWVSLGKIIFIIDAFVVVIASLAFESILLGLYALVCIYMSTKTIDTVLEGVSFARAVFIISSKNEIISNRIIQDIGRGVTVLKGVGAYTGQPRDILFCIVQRRQFPAVKELVREIDDTAFVILSDVREVLGEGFRSYQNE